MLREHLSLTPGSTKSPVVSSTNTNEEGRHFMTTGVLIHITVWIGGKFKGNMLHFQRRILA